jgi:hypothetical protein
MTRREAMAYVEHNFSCNVIHCMMHCGLITGKGESDFYAAVLPENWRFFLEFLRN